MYRRFPFDELFKTFNRSRVVAAYARKNIRLLTFKEIEKMTGMTQANTNITVKQMLKDRLLIEHNFTDGPYKRSFHFLLDNKPYMMLREAVLEIDKRYENE